MAEHTVGLILCEMRNLARSDLVVGGVLEYLQEGSTGRVINPGAWDRCRTDMTMAQISMTKWTAVARPKSGEL